MENIFAAHIDGNGRIQSVTEHNRHTAYFAKSEGVKCRLKYTAYLAGLLHDAGKATKLFDDYIREGDKSKRGTIDHSTAGGKFILETFGVDSGDKIGILTAEIIAVAIFSHHGLMDLVNENGEDCFSERIEKKNIYYEQAVENEINKNYSIDELEIYFNKAKNEIQCLLDKKFDEYVVERMLLSVLIAADRKDTIIAMGGKVIEDKFEREKLWHSFSERVEERISDFNLDTAINIERAKVSKDCLDFAYSQTGIYTLQFPTGAGKTIASLRFAVNHAEIHNKERIFYVAPFKTILEQNAKEIRDILKNDDAVLEHHSDVVVENNEEQWKYDYLTDTWESPVILTTFVQMMNTWFGHKTTSIRRLKSISNSIIIFDEIQSMPTNVICLFNSMSNVLAEKFNTTIILCSATQPALDSVPHPINITCPMINSVSDVFKAFKRNAVVDLTRDEGYEIEQVGKLALDKLETSLSGLVVVNKKKQAEELYNYINSSNVINLNVFYLTTNMCPQHRMDTLDEIKKMLKYNKRVVCISTNLIEAGVDISFNFAIRSLAGLDSIVQTVGRCNRNGKDKIGYVYIANINEKLTCSLNYVQRAKDCTQDFLYLFNTNKEKFENDIISPSALNEYYSRYFKAGEDEMMFKAKDTSIYEMLTHNRDWLPKNKRKHFMTQAFKSGAAEFKIIDDSTVGIIVPYGKGKELIEMLCGDCLKDMSQVKSILKQSQRYTVNVYQNKLNDLIEAGAIVAVESLGIYILKENAYDEKLGVSLEANMGISIIE